MVRARGRVTPRATPATCASASSASAGPASSTSPPTTRSPARRSSRSPASRSRSREELAARYRIEHRRRALGGPAGRRGPRRGQRRRADLPARPDRHRGAGARHPRPVREADRARRARGRRDGAGRARGRPRARGRLQPSPARRHPGAQGGHRRRPAGTPLLRQGVVAAPHGNPDARQLVHAGRAGGRRPAGRHRRARPRLLAVPARQPRGGRRQRLDLRPARHRRLRRRAPAPTRPGASDDKTVRRRGPGLGLHAPGRRRHAARRGQLGRAPPRRRRVRHHALRHRRRRRADRRRLCARGLAARLLRRRRQRGGDDRAREDRPRPPGRRRAVRGEGTRRRVGRYDGAGAAALAHIVDACYRSAAEQREIRLAS